MAKPKSLPIALVVPLALAAWISSASAYTTYTTNGTDNCAACHGDFLASGYIAKSDGVAWSALYAGTTITSLHDIHRRIIMPSNACDSCHNSGGRTPVNLDSSTGVVVGGTTQYAISCLGCHGRAETGEGGTVTSAGLRQHHWNSGITTCGTAGCHPGDANPTTFTTVGEDVLPPNYAVVDPDRPTKPSNPCNPDGNETFIGTFGLDNDGDGLYDQSDTDCQAPAPDINLNPFVLTFGAVPVGDSATLNGAIQNLGTVDLNVSAINLCAGTSAEFSWLPVAPFIVAPGASQALGVTYMPVDEGVDTGCLAISSNDPDEATIQLRLDNSAASSILRFTPAFIHPGQTGGQ